MTNETEDAVRWIAGEADEKAWKTHNLCGNGVLPNKKHEPTDECGVWLWGTGKSLPVSDGTLRLEDVGQIETWLAKAGYLWRNSLRGADFVISDEFNDVLSEGNGDSLPEALAEALKALHKAVIGNVVREEGGKDFMMDSMLGILGFDDENS